MRFSVVQATAETLLPIATQRQASICPAGKSPQDMEQKRRYSITVPPLFLSSYSYLKHAIYPIQHTPAEEDLSDILF